MVIVQYFPGNCYSIFRIPGRRQPAANIGMRIVGILSVEEKRGYGSMEGTETKAVPASTGLRPAAQAQTPDEGSWFFRV